MDIIMVAVMVDMETAVEDGDAADITTEEEMDTTTGDFLENEVDAAGVVVMTVEEDQW